MRREEVATSSQNLTAKCNNHTDCETVKPYFGIEEINNFVSTSETEGSGRRTDTGPRSPGARGAALAAPAPGELAGPGAVLILDTSTPKLGHLDSSIGRLFNRRNRKLWSRAIWGLKLPGRYYFLTLTTTPESPSLVKVWHNFQRWMKRYRPGVCWIYCFTNEGKGKGVLHMVLRLGMKQKRVDADELRAYWYSLTGATQMKIKRVPEVKKEDLALYLANQKNKRGMAKEMGYQSAVTRWRWSSGWLPKGFTREFGRAWVRLNGVPYGLKLKVLSDWLHNWHEHNGATWTPARLFYDSDHGWISDA